MSLLLQSFPSSLSLFSPSPSLLPSYCPSFPFFLSLYIPRPPFFSLLCSISLSLSLLFPPSLPPTVLLYVSFCLSLFPIPPLSPSLLHSSLSLYPPRLPHSDLDNSSSTVASTEGDSDSKNGDSPPSSLVNPLPDGSDQNELDDGSKQSGGAASKTSVSGGSLVKQQSSLPLNSEISMVTLRLALPGVSQPVEVVVRVRLSTALLP